MTYEDIYNEFCKKFPKAKVEDYRPAFPFYVSELSQPIPYAIVLWLKDRSKIIYKTKGEEEK